MKGHKGQDIKVGQEIRKGTRVNGRDYLASMAAAWNCGSLAFNVLASHWPPFIDVLTSA